MNKNNEDPIKQRKTYEINELLKTGDKKLVKLYLALKNASEFLLDLFDKLEINLNITYNENLIKHFFQFRLANYINLKIIKYKTKICFIY